MPDNIIRGASINGMRIFSSGIVLSGLILYLDAGDTASYPGTGTTWTDLSGNSNNGTLTNGPTYTSTSPQYFTFNGSTQYATIANYSTYFNFSTSTPFSIAVWLRLTTANSNFKAVVNSANSSNQWNYGLYISSSNQLFSGYHDNASGVGATLATATWYQCVLVYASSLHSLYLNTVLQGTLNLGLGTYGSQTLAIGRKGNIGADYFPGDVAITQIYNRALTTTEILQNYNATRSRFGI